MFDCKSTCKNMCFIGGGRVGAVRLCSNFVVDCWVFLWDPCGFLAGSLGILAESLRAPCGMPEMVAQKELGGMNALLPKQKNKFHQGVSPVKKSPERIWKEVGP